MSSLSDDARKLQDECLRVLVKKNRDYGRENITEEGTAGIAVRLRDKVNRLRNLTRAPGIIAENEDVRDTFLDVANYGLIGMMLCDHTWQGPVLADKEEIRPLRVYLGGPIDDISVEESMGWRGRVGHRLEEYHITSFNPHTAFFGANMDNASFVTSINRAAVAMCDVVLIYLSGNGRAFGTMRELEFARSLGKKVIVVSWEPIVSLEVHDVDIFEDLDNAVNWIIRLSEDQIGTTTAGNGAISEVSGGA